MENCPFSDVVSLFKMVIFHPWTKAQRRGPAACRGREQCPPGRWMGKMFTRYIGKSTMKNGQYPLVNIQKAMENHPFEWENPWWMAIFNSYFDITRGYIHKNGDEWRCFLGYTLNGHQTRPENPQNHRWFPQLETLNGGFHGGKNWCFLLRGSYQDVGNKWGYHQPMDWYSNKWGLYLKYSMGKYHLLGLYLKYSMVFPTNGDLPSGEIGEIAW